jgi:hypothetical protein
MNLSIRMLLGVVALCATSYRSPKAQTSVPSEWKVDLAAFGFKAGPCASRQSVSFLDDEHLVLSAPLAQTCDKRDSWKPLPTQLSVIDLQGHEQASIKRDDIVQAKEGPTGFIAVCTPTSIELLPMNLVDAHPIPVSLRSGNGDACFDIGGLSPSRAAMSIIDYDESSGIAMTRYRLFRGRSSQPVAQTELAKDQSIVAITDNGYAVCGREGKRNCARLTVNGIEWKYTPPADGFWIAGFLAADQLLQVDYAGTSLVSIAPDGRETEAANIRKFRPPFINANGVELSASEPRRILYWVSGCPLGDFDDCYGLFFHRFVVFDSQTRQPLFHHSFNPNFNPSISPDGHLVSVLDGAELRMYSIP